MTPIRALLLLSLSLTSCQAAPVAPDTAAAGRAVVIGDMRTARALHTATRLPDGRVLFVGGGSPETPTASAEIYDPATGKVQLVGSMRAPRLAHTATLLRTGKVLVVGGWGAGLASTQTAELFDPATLSFSAAPAPREPRSDHAAVELENGNILILGGDISGVGNAPTAAAEIYDPQTDRFTLTGNMTIPRVPYGAVRLEDGRVLVAGGTTTGTVTGTAEIYDPVQGVFTRVGSLAGNRRKHGTTMLPNGQVMVMGGSTSRTDSDILTSTELYDPVSGRFAAGPRMHAGRYKVSVADLPDGSVLIAGGGVDLLELYLPGDRAFHRVPGASGSSRFFPTTTLLFDGSVLIAGGYAAGGSKTTLWRFSLQ